MRWFQRFEEESIQQSLRVLKWRASKSNKHIKIAILDTGVDVNNTWISQNLGRIRCWPDNAQCDDRDGHGTHVAHLLLRLAPHAHLRVAKVSSSRLLRDADIEHIAHVT
jgi:hypothetical protein